MKRYKDFSVKAKVSISIGIISLVIMTSICLLSVIPLRKAGTVRSAKMAQTTATNAGLQLAERINGSAKVLRAFSGVIRQIAISSIIPDSIKREILLEELIALAETEKTLSDLWCIIEPNALDGRDSYYYNNTGSNQKGIFVPWISGGQVATADHMLNTESYKRPKVTGKEFISEPYVDDFNGKKIQIFSLSIPIVIDGKFIGIIATDFHTEELGAMLAKINAKGNGRLITDKGNIATHQNPQLVGKQAENQNSEILDRLEEGKLIEGMYEIDGKEVYKVFVPAQLGNDSKSWFYAIDTPAKDVYAMATSVTKQLVTYCSLGIVIIMIAVWILMSYTLIDVERLTRLIRRLSLGHININILENDSQDEIGQMNGEIGKLVNGLKNTAKFAKNIGEGQLDVQYNLLSEDDLLGQSLIEMQQSLKKADDEQALYKKEEEQRNWGTAGLAKFAEILRQDNSNMNVLTNNVICNLVSYLEANQGGIFIVSEAERAEDRVLELKACYAYDRKKFLKKQVRIGEGLVGACFLERAPVYLTNIPDDYINITSGLGDANPRSLLISPLKINDDIYGVLEVASFNLFEPFQREFVQKLCESIAATVSTVNINIRTNKLLMQTKMQAEEMANNEEELRQTMEEMQATQEEMRRREIELNETLAKMQEMHKTR